MSDLHGTSEGDAPPELATEGHEFMDVKAELDPTGCLNPGVVYVPGAAPVGATVPDATLAPDALSLAILEKFDNTQPADTYVASSALAQEVASTERESIELMLRKQGYNRAATARALGISRVTLYNKLRKYRIDVDQMSDDE